MARTILVQIAPGDLPYENDAVEALWDRLEGWMEATLAPLGGECTGVDFSSEMTAMGEADDADAAVEALKAALPGAELPPVLIAVRTEDEEDDFVVWPQERAGEELPG